MKHHAEDLRLAATRTGHHDDDRRIVMLGWFDDYSEVIIFVPVIYLAAQSSGICLPQACRHRWVGGFVTMVSIYLLRLRRRDNDNDVIQSTKVNDVGKPKAVYKLGNPNNDQ